MSDDLDQFGLSYSGGGETQDADAEAEGGGGLGGGAGESKMAYLLLGQEEYLEHRSEVTHCK